MSKKENVFPNKILNVKSQDSYATIKKKNKKVKREIDCLHLCFMENVIYLGYQNHFNHLNKVKIVKLSKVQILRSPKSFYFNDFHDSET